MPKATADPFREEKMSVKFTTARGSVYGNLCTLDQCFKNNKEGVEKMPYTYVKTYRHSPRTLIFSEPFRLFALILGDRKTVPKNALADALDES